MQKLKLVISDFHLSRGNWLPDGRRNPLEDFHQDQRLFEMLDHYSSGPHADSDVELIVNGDFFDPLAVIPVAVAAVEVAAGRAAGFVGSRRRIAWVSSATFTGLLS